MVGMGLSKRFVVVEIAVRVVITAGVFFVVFGFDPFVRIVQPSDWENHSFPFREDETFPVWLAVLISAILAIGTLVLWLLVLKLVLKWPFKKVLYEGICACLSCSLALLATLLIVEMCKRMYGRPRPDFLSRCFGNDKEAWPKDIPGIPTCTETDEHKLTDGRMSFPSGHASLTASAFTWVALYNFSKLSMIRQTGSLRIALPFSVYMFPTAVAMTRTSDYRHFLSDVMTGLLLGTGLTVIVFLFYHPVYLKPLDSESARFFTPAVGEEVPLPELLEPGPPITDQERLPV